MGSAQLVALLSSYSQHSKWQTNACRLVPHRCHAILAIFQARAYDLPLCKYCATRCVQACMQLYHILCLDQGSTLYVPDKPLPFAHGDGSRPIMSFKLHWLL